MASDLRNHWAKVFRARPTDTALRAQWLAEDLSRRSSSLPSSSSRWMPSRGDVRKALERSGSSTPGPDGIPASAWRALGPLAEKVLHEALSAMSGPGGLELLEAEYNSFNEALLFFIPKKVSGFDDAVGEYYDPEHTRPITVTNFDNRILASAVRFRIEPLLAKWVSPKQRGFIGGRSMLANIIDIDEIMQHTALGYDDGFAVMFDFKAAFPSVDHAFMMDLFAHIGLPDFILGFIRALYFQNHCSIVAGGVRHVSFVVV